MRSALIVCALSMSFAGAAQAADNGIYIGGGVTRTSIDTGSDFVESAPDFSLDDEDNGFKVIAGIRPFDWLGFEANYVDFGNIELNSSGATLPSGEFELTGIDAFAVGYLPVAFVDVFAKAGVIRWDSESAVTGGLDDLDFSDSDSGTDFAYGAGVQARLGSLGARLEYERFEVDNTEEVAMISLGLTYTFL